MNRAAAAIALAVGLAAGAIVTAMVLAVALAQMDGRITKLEAPTGPAEVHSFLVNDPDGTVAYLCFADARGLKWCDRQPWGEVD